MRDFIDAKAFPAIFEHLRHERHCIEPAAIIQRREDFVLRANLDEFASVKVELLIGD
jgi:hypothetical protein